MDVHCVDPDHISMIDTLYADIVAILHSSASRTLSMDQVHVGNTVPGWNDHLKGLYQLSRTNFRSWSQSGRPREGLSFHAMKDSRRKFKYALRECKRNEVQMKADGLARNLCDKDMRGFWQAIRKMNGRKSGTANCIGEACGMVDIATMWQGYFQDVFQAVSNTETEKLALIDKIAMSVKYNDRITVSKEEVMKSISSLKAGKAAGLDRLIMLEHFIVAHDSIAESLASLFRMMFVHCHMPAKLTDVILLPLVKNKNKDITDKSNYRPIAIANTMSKIFEQIFLDRIDVWVRSCDNQFGFKQYHSTDMCIFAVKEVIHYYRSRGSPVFACLLDASKAFDRINHCTLFGKMLAMGCEPFIVRILIAWYRMQRLCVRWGNVISDFFTVSCGVRQGSVLSPVLLNMYMNGL